MDSSNEQPILSITGKKVALGPHRRDLLPLYQRWINDFEIVRMLSARLRPMTLESEEEWYTRVTQSDRDVVFTIYELQSMRPIGTAGMHNIDYSNGTGEFGIMIGEKDCWGKGFGTEATILVLDTAFTGLGLHNVMLRVHAYNERGIGAYTRAGFRIIGRRREAHRIGGKTYDDVLMDCLSTEFHSPILASLVPQ